MDFFDIHFTGDAPRKDMPDCIFGQICIGLFREKFLSDVTYWPRARYEQQWLDAALSIRTSSHGALITSICEPSSSDFVRWWALYREGSSVVVQEQICFLDELHDPFEPDRVEAFVRPRMTTSEDGQPISEWVTSVAAVEEFARRRAR